MIKPAVSDPETRAEDMIILNVQKERTNVMEDDELKEL